MPPLDDVGVENSETELSPSQDTHLHVHLHVLSRFPPCSLGEWERVYLFSHQIKFLLEVH